MSDYGLTPKGPNIKRLDTILEEMHTDLSDKLGVNTKQNTQSLLNVLITNFADRIAELWELGEHVYHSQYPSSAEGTNLDSAAQFGGITRETASKSYYPIHCTGTDGTLLVEGTQIATNTNPKTYLSIAEEKTITRSSFNKVQIRVASARMGDTYTAVIDGSAFSFVAQNAVPLDILNGLAEAITTTNFEKTVRTEDLLLVLTSTDVAMNHNLVLSENLTTETVTTVITFGTDELGNILIPNGAITEIVQADAGLLSVDNQCEYIAGRNAETDTELRKSYSDKIFNRSSMMLESVKSAILNNVQGVESVAAYENTTDYATMTILCTGQETQNYWYYFKYDDLYFLFKMPQVYAGDKFIFGSTHKTLVLQHNDTTTEIPLTVSYNAPSELTYTCRGNESVGSLYYFVREHLYYIFTMPSVSLNDKFVFDESNKTLKMLSSGATSFITMDAGFEAPHNLKYTATGNEEGIFFFKYKSVYYVLVSSLNSGDVLRFDTESKVITRKRGSTTTTLTPYYSEKTPCNLVYSATGEETSGDFVYFVFDGVYYEFEYPNLNEGDIIRFNPDDKTLVRVRNGSNTTINKVAAAVSPKLVSYEFREDDVPEALYYFRYRDYKYRYCSFTMPAEAEEGCSFLFNPNSCQLFYIAGEGEDAVQIDCKITDAAPEDATNVSNYTVEEDYGTNITAEFDTVGKGTDITSGLTSDPTTDHDITNSFNETQLEATDLTEKIVSGMPPHSIEIVVEGGDSAEIAQQILNNKAGGITTYGSQSVPIATAYGEEVVVNFNRPIKTYVWFRLALTLRSNEPLPENYVNLLKNTILEKVNSLNSGEDVVPQEFMSDLYEACSGIAYIDISLFGTNVEGATPPSYPSRIIEISDRQRAYTTASMIEVVIPNG